MNLSLKNTMDTIFTILIAIIGMVFFTNLGIHKIEEGHVGVYYRVSLFTVTSVPVKMSVSHLEILSGRRFTFRNKSTRVPYDDTANYYFQTSSGIHHTRSQYIHILIVEDWIVLYFGLGSRSLCKLTRLKMYHVELVVVLWFISIASKLWISWAPKVVSNVENWT